MTLIATSDCRSHPSAAYRFFVYDQDGDGLLFYRTAEIRDAVAKQAIRNYCDGDGWHEEVTTVCVGEVTAKAQKTNVTHKPKRDDFETDEEFEDAMEEWPDADHDYTCDFELLPLSQGGKQV